MSLLELDSVSKSYRIGRRVLPAVEDVTLGIDPGEIVGLVGESGSGKSTLARLALRLLSPESGEVRFAGRNLAGMAGTELAGFRRRVQIVFQDPLAALNPRATVRRLIRGPLRLHRIVPPGEIEVEVRRLMELAGLPPAFAERRPRQISGGERQRVAVLQALPAGDSGLR
jgi:peptide/nickel transport system ATP-binding protein